MSGTGVNSELLVGKMQKSEENGAETHVSVGFSRKTGARVNGSR
jgi:hypothetical protein